MAVAWPKKFKTHNLPRLIWAAKSSRGANFFHPSHFTRYTSFTASQPRKNGRCLAKKSQNTQFATFNLGCKNFARRKIFSSPAISHVTRLLRRPNHAKMAVAWPKTVKTHNLPRLIWAAKSSRRANFFHPSHFPRYTSFTASQPRKNGRCLAKKSQNSQFATFNLGCKNLARRELFSSQPFPTLHVFTASQPRKIDRCLAKNSQNTQFATFNFGCKKFARRELFSSPAISHVTRPLRRPNHAKMAVVWPRTVKTHNLPRLIWAAKRSRGAIFFHPQPFPMLHVFYGVPTTQKWSLPGQKKSKLTICHV